MSSDERLYEVIATFSDGAEDVWEEEGGEDPEEVTRGVVAAIRSEGHYVYIGEGQARWYAPSMLLTVEVRAEPTP